MVLSGHGPQTTIGRERATNPYLREVAARPRRRLHRRSATRNVTRPSVSTFQAPKGTYDLLPPDSATYPRGARGDRRAAAELRVRLRRDARLRERRAVLPRRRRVHRHRDQGDVHLRRPRAATSWRCAPRAPPPCCAPRWRPTCTRRQPPGQALVLRLVLPLRAPAEGPLPPLLAGRRRGDRRRGPGAGRRVDHPGRPGLPLAGPARASASCSTRWATRSAARSTAPRSRTSCAGSTWTRRPARRVEINPLRVLDDKREAVQKQLAGAPAAARLPLRGVQGVPRAGARAADRGGRAPSRTTRSWSAAWTTTPAPPSSSSTTASARSPRWAAAAATTACPR